MGIVVDSDEGPPPEPVTYLWDCVKDALAANGHPAPSRIDRMAAAAGLELAESTISGWFKTWSVVPAWEKFDVLIKALGAERDEDWRSLHGAALIADRKRKKESRHRKNHMDGEAASVPSQPIATDPQPHPQESTDAPDPVPTDTVPAAVDGGALSSVNLWRTSWMLGAAAVVLALVLVYMFRPIGESEQIPSGKSGVETPGSTPSDQPAHVPVRYCAYVIKEPAVVYPIPDTNSHPIKFKYLDNRIEVLDRPHPPGWAVVRTPRNAPGYNWMQTAVLTAPAPC